MNIENVLGDSLSSIEPTRSLFFPVATAGIWRFIECFFFSSFAECHTQ
jgi:hypothetical protein